MKQKFFTSSITFIRKFLTGSFMFKHLRALNLYALEDFSSSSQLRVSPPQNHYQETPLAWGRALQTLPTRTLWEAGVFYMRDYVMSTHCSGDIFYTVIQPRIHDPKEKEPTWISCLWLSESPYGTHCLGPSSNTLNETYHENQYAKRSSTSKLEWLPSPTSKEFATMWSRSVSKQPRHCKRCHQILQFHFVLSLSGSMPMTLSHQTKEDDSKGGHPPPCG